MRLGVALLELQNYRAGEHAARLRLTPCCMRRKEGGRPKTFMRKEVEQEAPKQRHRVTQIVRDYEETGFHLA